jgi:hypothetical protein
MMTWYNLSQCVGILESGPSTSQRKFKVLNDRNNCWPLILPSRLCETARNVEEVLL